MSSPIDFHAIFELSPNPYMIVDRELRYVAANAAYLEVTSSTREGLLGRPLFDAFPHDPNDPNNRPARMLRESLDRVLATRARDSLALIPYRVPKRTAEGVVVEERYWSATHTPLLDEHGEVAYILQHTVDVTELQHFKQAAETAGGDPPRTQVEQGVLLRAQAVQETNFTLGAEVRHLRAIFEQAPGFIAYLSGPEHVFTLANRAYRQLTGHRRILELSVREALPEIEGQGFLELLDRVYATNEPFIGRGMAVLLQRHPGAQLEEAILDFVYQPVVDAAGKVIGIFVEGNDRTEQRRLETERAMLYERERAARAEAEEANRLKDVFLATVSHELRTPLTAMLGWVQMLRSGHLPPDRTARALETIERNARIQTQLIEDLLDISRIISGKMKLEVETMELAPIIEAALDAVRPAAEAKGIALLPALDARAYVRGDAARLQQVIWNLLSNAVKFTPKGGKVQVLVEQRESSVEVAVRDSGEGIEPGFLPYVFERFRQANGAANRPHGGLGLGLAIVKHLVELHGGTIRAESEGLGRGASFTVRLPLAALRQHEPSLVPTALSRSPALQDLNCPPELRGLRLLVVEDELDSRELLRALLESCGAQVETACSAAEGLARLRAFKPEILISDIGMPGEDGYALIRQVRALPAAEGGRVPAVALTAYARADDRTRALRAGFKSHVPKPVEPAELLAVLAALVSPPGQN